MPEVDLVPDQGVPLPEELHKLLAARLGPTAPSPSTPCTTLRGRTARRGDSTTPPPVRGDVGVPGGRTRTGPRSPGWPAALAPGPGRGLGPRASHGRRTAAGE